MSAICTREQCLNGIICTSNNYCEINCSSKILYNLPSMIISSAKTKLYKTFSHYHNNTLLDIINLLQLSITHKSISLTHQCHAQLISQNLTQNPFVAVKLITSYSTCKTPGHAKLVFDSIHLPNVFLWNSLINGYVKNSSFFTALQLFDEMCNKGCVLPDDYTLSMIAKVCGDSGDLRVGSLIHGKCVRVGCVRDTFVANSIMSMYHKCGVFEESLKVFDEMPCRNTVSWNAVISGYAGSSDVGFDENVFRFIREMQIEGMKPDAFTVSSVLTLCGDHKGKCDYGKELHCYIVRNGFGFGCDVHLGSCLIEMYSKSGRNESGRLVFERMMHRNLFVWTSMINGYVNLGDSEQALTFFNKMQTSDKIKPNKVSLLSVLPACSNSHSGLTGGKEIHAFALRNGLNRDIALCNALIDMYSKCGSLSYAKKMFEDESLCKDTISWTSMISGYGLHGKGKEAVFLFNEMCEAGIKPDMITIVGVLCACSKASLVNDGLAIYESLVNKYQLEPSVEACACVVDMLGRAGRLDEALQFIKIMPVQPGPSVWAALSSGSITHGNATMQDLAHQYLIQLEPGNPSNYVSASNVLASTGKWGGAAGIRRLMKERGLKKVPGCSWINLGAKTHCFVVADKSHPFSCLIYEILNNLAPVMKGDDDAYCNDSMYIV